MSGVIESRGVEVWVDGAVYNAGTRMQVGALGIFVADAHPENKSIFVHDVCTPPFKLTNQYMELCAARAGLETAVRIIDMLGHKLHPTVYTTSVHVINCMTNWVNIWERTGYVTKNKRPVQHTDFIRNLRRLQQASGGQFVRINPTNDHHGRNHSSAVQLAAQAAADGGRVGCRKININLEASTLLPS